MKLDLLSRKLPLYLAGLILVLLLLSSLVFLFRQDSRIKRTFQFPDKNYTLDAGVITFSWETRLLPQRRTTEGDIRLFVEEILLGPMDPAHEKLFASDTRLNTVMIEKGTLCLNFSYELLEKDVIPGLPLKEKIDLLKNNILFNFRNIKECRLFVEGQSIEQNTY